MIYDCFQFFNEIDLLKLRLNVLDPVVDKFVISESTRTFSGDAKPLYYDENRALFKAFEHKIIHNVVSDTPDVSPFERDSFEKTAVKRGLVNCRDEDIILFSDLDEIPDPDKIKAVSADIEDGKVYHFAQRIFFYYLNLEEISGSFLSFTGEFEGVKRKKWLGSKMFKFGLLKDRTTESMRFPEMKNIGIRIDDGGWHFSYIGGDGKTGLAERVAHKIRSAAHQEYNNQKVLSKIEDNIRKKKDIFGRKATFKRMEIDSSFPQYLVNNKSEFGHLILPKEEERGLFKWLK